MKDAVMENFLCQTQEGKLPGSIAWSCRTRFGKGTDAPTRIFNSQYLEFPYDVYNYRMEKQRWFCGAESPYTLGQLENQCGELEKYTSPPQTSLQNTAILNEKSSFSLKIKRK